MSLYPTSILTIEDDKAIAAFLQTTLEREGFTAETVNNGRSALDRINQSPPNLILLDLMLPGMDGLELCQAIRRRPAYIPIIMVTAKGEESDIVLGLGIGADDYVTKPFSPKELMGRVKAVLRRGPLKEGRGAGERIVRNKVVIDAGRHEVRVEGKAIVFTATEFRLLHFLASHPGRVFTRDQLLNRAIGEGVIVLDRNIDVHIRAVRKKLGSYQDLIETIRGVGYRFRYE